MWHQPSNNSHTSIPPNLLKNFNIYEILEPQKNGANNSIDLKVDKLIDIDECSRDSGIQDCDSNALFVDQNKEFDLVDLYQNIFVTPQHIKQKDTNRNINCESKTVNIDLEQFLEKMEASKRNNLIQQTDKVNCFNNSCFNNFDDFVKPKDLTPKELPEPDSDPEDLINEILTQKAIEKRALDEIKRLPNKHPESSSTVENIVTDLSHLSFYNNVVNETEMKNITNDRGPSDLKTQTVNSEKCLTDFVVRCIQKDEKLYKKNRVVKPEYLTASYTKGPDYHEKSIILPQIMANLKARRCYLDEINQQKKRLILDKGSRTEKTETQILKVRDLPKRTNLEGASATSTKPINKDTKLCMNSVNGSISVHSKNLKNPFKGTGISTKPDGGFGKLSPTVLMEDCNKERLKALTQSQMFKNFVFTGKFEP